MSTPGVGLKDEMWGAVDVTSSERDRKGRIVYVENDIIFRIDDLCLTLRLARNSLVGQWRYHQLKSRYLFSCLPLAFRTQHFDLAARGIGNHEHR